MKFFQYEHAKKGFHIIVCRILIAVVRFESEVG